MVVWGQDGGQGVKEEAMVGPFGNGIKTGYLACLSREHALLG